MIYCFENERRLIDKLCDDFRNLISEHLKSSDSINIALSGGNTPRDFLSAMAAYQTGKNGDVQWDRIHFYWSDERCVPPDDTESNYHMAYHSLFSRISISPKNLHRIIGENDPHLEAKRYSEEIAVHVPCRQNKPVFDLIFLGIGEDGHCASIFPDRMDLLNSPNICEAVKHPVSEKYRVTLTGLPLIISRHIIFLATGIKKSEIIGEVFNNSIISSGRYPAAWVNRNAANIDWYFDSEAVNKTKSLCRGQFKTS